MANSNIVPRSARVFIVLFTFAAFATIGAGCAPLGVSLDRPSEPALELARWDFDSAESAAGWIAGEGVAELHAAGGVLRGTTTSGDAYIFAPAVHAPLDGLTVRVRWRGSNAGSGQCYFATNHAGAMSEERMRHAELPGDEFVQTEFALSGDPVNEAGEETRLTRFRLDPFNGPAGTEFEIDEVVVFQRPTALEIDFVTLTPIVKPGETAVFELRARHIGGRSPHGMLRARIESAGETIEEIELPLAGELSTRRVRLEMSRDGVHTVVARIASSEGPSDRVTHVLEANAVADDRPTLRDPAFVRDDVAVEFVDRTESPGEAHAAYVWLREGAAWREAALLSPLAEITTVERNDVVSRRSIGFRRGPSAKAWFSLEGGSTWRAALDFRIERAGLLAVNARVAGPEGGRLLRFAGPTVRRRPRDPSRILDRHGLFGGIEFLEPGWRSSSARAVGERFAERWLPHPFRICLPAMAIEQDGITTAVLWNPEEEWSPGHRMPQAAFASPNFIEGETDHLMQLALPSIGSYAEENSRGPGRAFVIEDARPLRLSMALLVSSEKSIGDVPRAWYRHFGIPEGPPMPHDAATTYDLIAKCYGETLYWADENGWRGHWFIENSSHRRPEFAAELLLHARRRDDWRWVEATGVDRTRSVIATHGLLWDRALHARAAADRALRAMREDGTFAFTNTAAMRERTSKATGGKHDTLGDDGSTSLGTCVQGALPLVRYYFLSGDERYREPVRRALNAMSRFRVPRGAQVWEVHQQIPDIRAAALAVDAHRMAYLLTGDEEYLARAFDWADTGLAFLFSWQPALEIEGTIRASKDREDPKSKPFWPLAAGYENPERQVNPYGTIPVLGTTYYVVSWFGVLVQWCGLEWAWKVNELLDLRDDEILRAAAGGVLRSALQQVFDREPWTGLFPDVWNLEGNWAGGAFISPRLVVGAARSSGMLPPELATWSRRVESGEREQSDARVVHGWGKLVSCGLEGGELVIELEMLAGEECEILVTRCERPTSATVNERALTGDSTSSEHWRYDEERRLLGLRFRADKGVTRVRLR